MLYKLYVSCSNIILLYGTQVYTYEVIILVYMCVYDDMICLMSLFQAKLGLSDGTTQAARTLKDRSNPDRFLPCWPSSATQLAQSASFGEVQSIMLAARMHAGACAGHHKHMDVHQMHTGIEPRGPEMNALYEAAQQLLAGSNLNFNSRCDRWPEQAQCIHTVPSRSKSAAQCSKVSLLVAQRCC